MPKFEKKMRIIKNGFMDYRAQRCGETSLGDWWEDILRDHWIFTVRHLTLRAAKETLKQHEKMVLESYFPPEPEVVLEHTLEFEVESEG